MIPATPTPLVHLPTSLQISMRRPRQQRRSRWFLPPFSPFEEFDKVGDEAKLAEIVAPTKKDPPIVAPSRPVHPKGFQIVKAGSGYANEDKEKKKKKKNRRWKWIPIISRIVKQRDVEKKKNKFVYPVHWIRPKGFTELEYELCQPYMAWCDFEFQFPIPKEYRRFKEFLDQVRRTKGYGVTISKPRGFSGPDFFPISLEGRDRPHPLEMFMTDMILDLIEEIQRKFKDFKAAGLQLTNLVECPDNNIYLLSHSFEPQTITRESKRTKGEEEAEVDVLQSMFFVPPHVIGLPSLLMWKLKKGSHLIYSSKSTKGAEEHVASCNRIP